MKEPLREAVFVARATAPEFVDLLPQTQPETKLVHRTSPSPQRRRGGVIGRAVGEVSGPRQIFGETVTEGGAQVGREHGVALGGGREVPVEAEIASSLSV